METNIQIQNDLTDSLPYKTSHRSPEIDSAVKFNVAPLICNAKSCEQKWVTEEELQKMNIQVTGSSSYEKKSKKLKLYQML